MKAINTLLSILFLGVITSNLNGKPSNKISTHTSDIVDRHLSGFNAINLAGPFDVMITQGSQDEVKVEAPNDVMERIVTEVNEGVLKIYSKHDNWNWGNWWGNHKKIMIYVKLKNVNSINISGSGDIKFKEGITTDNLKLSISGSGDMDGQLEAKNLECSISGSGDMKLSGKAENSKVRVVGSGDFTAKHLLTVNSSVHVSGSGDAEINASEKIEASVNGSGDIHYTGDAKMISKSKSGSGDISRF